MSEDDRVQRELGVLSTEVKNIVRAFQAFHDEERAEHKTINTAIAEVRSEIGELKTGLELHQAASRTQRRTLATVTGVIAAAATAGALKLWQFLMHK